VEASIRTRYADHARDLQDWTFPSGQDSLAAGECFDDPLERGVNANICGVKY